MDYPSAIAVVVIIFLLIPYLSRTQFTIAYFTRSDSEIGGRFQIIYVQFLQVESELELVSYEDTKSPSFSLEFHKHFGVKTNVK